MGLLNTVAEGATAVTIVLLVVLVVVWGRNYARFRSKQTLGLTVFGVLLLLENLVELYFYLWDPMMHGWWHQSVPSAAVRATMLLDLIEFGAVSFLAWVSWD